MLLCQEFLGRAGRPDVIYGRRKPRAARRFAASIVMLALCVGLVGCNTSSGSGASSGGGQSDTTAAHYRAWNSIQINPSAPRHIVGVGTPVSVNFLERSSSQTLPAAAGWSFALPDGCDGPTCGFQFGPSGYQCSGIGSGALRCDFRSGSGQLRRVTFLSDGRVSLSRAEFSFDEPDYFRSGVWYQTAAQRTTAQSQWARMVSLYSGERLAQSEQRAAEQRQNTDRAIRNATAILTGVVSGLSGQPSATGTTGGGSSFHCDPNGPRATLAPECRPSRCESLRACSAASGSIQ